VERPSIMILPGDKLKSRHTMTGFLFRLAENLFTCTAVNITVTPF
jgi:hypothetical protein